MIVIFIKIHAYSLSCTCGVTGKKKSSFQSDLWSDK